VIVADSRKMAGRKIKPAKRLGDFSAPHFSAVSNDQRFRLKANFSSTRQIL
jgi:hypothetical protein